MVSVGIRVGQIRELGVGRVSDAGGRVEVAVGGISNAEVGLVVTVTRNFNFDIENGSLRWIYS